MFGGLLAVGASSLSTGFGMLSASMTSHEILDSLGIAIWTLIAIGFTIMVISMVAPLKRIGDAFEGLGGIEYSTLYWDHFLPYLT